jgi:predicted transglutaminase-like cysteine proteinase
MTTAAQAAQAMTTAAQAAQAMTTAAQAAQAMTTAAQAAQAMTTAAEAAVPLKPLRQCRVMNITAISRPSILLFTTRRFDRNFSVLFAVD